METTTETDLVTHVRRLMHDAEACSAVTVAAVNLLAEHVEALQRENAGIRKELDRQERWLRDLLEERPLPPRPREQLPMFDNVLRRDQ